MIIKGFLICQKLNKIKGRKTREKNKEKASNLKRVKKTL